jgi:hypothetical protein
VADVIETLEHLMAETSAKDFAIKQYWIRDKLFQLFMELVDIHGIHLGKAPFTDVWVQRYKERVEMARELEAKEGYEALIVVNELDDF